MAKVGERKSLFRSRWKRREEIFPRAFPISDVNPFHPIPIPSVSFINRLTKPDKKKLFYIPQRPYMPIGSLRDQVIYPDSPSDMMTKGLSDSDLADLLDKVQLRYLLDREDSTGWNTERDWMDTLSGGKFGL